MIEFIEFTYKDFGNALKVFGLIAWLAICARYVFKGITFRWKITK
jgi:hypothetical protein